jgi:tetratricopeptide (TPR) repeat protein
MSEMLGNHYFQMRKYMLAEQVYEKLSPKELSNTKILKNLIICYTQTNKLQKSLELLLHLVEIDIASIIKSKDNEDDCPCNDLIFNIESSNVKYANEVETYTALGILWLFCNHKISFNYFKMASGEDPSNNTIKNILVLIKNYSNQINFNLN